MTREPKDTEKRHEAMKHTMHTPAAALAAILVLAVPGFSQLSGAYTVNPTAPAGGGNYQTLGAAATDLQTLGVSGPVTFDIYDDAGAYTEANAMLAATNPGTATLTLTGTLIAGVSSTNTITFRAAPGESPVFNATGRSMGVSLYRTSYVTIQGIEIFGATNDGVSIYTDAAVNAAPVPAVPLLGNQVIGCRIHDCGGCGVSMYGNGGVANPQIGDTIIRNNFFRRLQLTNVGTFNTLARFGYICERRSGNAVIENNSFYVDTGAGANFCVIGSDYGAPFGGPSASVQNNLIQKIPGTTVVGSIYRRNTAAGQLPLIQNYNVYDDTSAGTFLAGIAAAATLAAFQAANPTLEVAGITGLAGYLSPGTGDLHITPASSGFNAGNALAGVVDDIDGQARPIAGSYDAGADETPATGLYAGFTAAPLSGAAPLLVNFTDTSYSSDPAGVATWSWDFQNDGIPDNNTPNPSFTYTCPGTYSVSLTVTDASNPTSTVVKTNYIVVSNFVFSISSSGGGAGDLTITPVPTSCGPAAGAVQGWTLASLATSGPVGTGPFVGLVPDSLTVSFITNPGFPGNPIHFIVFPGFYPDTGALIFPAPLFAALAGFSMDAVMVYFGASGNLLHVSNVSRTTF